MTEEEKLTIWAKKELAKARSEPTESYTNLDDI